MFSGDIQSVRASWAFRRSEVLIGTFIGILVALLLVSPRLTPFFLLALAIAWLWIRLPQRGLAAAMPEIDGLTASIGALLFYALLSSLWAVAPAATIGKVGLMLATVLISLVTVRLLWAEGRMEILHPAEGLWLGLLVGLLFYCAESVSGQAIKIWVVNTFKIGPELLQPDKAYSWSKDGRLLSVAEAAFTRSATPITLLLWPALMAALGAIARPWSKPIAMLMFVLAIAAVFLSPQESSKTAIVAGVAAFALTHISARWALRMIALFWITACLAVVPLAMLAHRLDLHNAAWLQTSAQHRIIIWNFTAEQALQAPLFGIGAYMTYIVGPTITAKAVNSPGEHLQRKLSRHSHDVYLQTWFELGAVGALLLMTAGLTVLGRIGRLGSAVQPFGFAAFCSAATLMASSYGIWQSWYMAMFGLAAVAFAIGARAFETAGGWGTIGKAPVS